MNRLDAALATALRTKAERAGQAVDASRARAAVEARLDRVDHRRRRRVWLVPVAVGAAAAAVAVIVFAGRDLHQAGPLPPTHPSPTGTSFTLARDPFETSGDLAMTRTPTPDARTLGRCLSDPRGWGADQAQAATFAGSGEHAARMNEFVLRFADPAAAHRAVVTAWSRLRTCHFSSPRLSEPAPAVVAGSTQILDDRVVGQYIDASVTNPATGMSSHNYSVMIGRAANLVVVFEGLDIDTGRSQYFLQRALDRASPEYRAVYPVDVCFVGSQPCPTQ